MEVVVVNCVVNRRPRHMARWSLGVLALVVLLPVSLTGCVNDNFVRRVGTQLRLGSSTTQLHNGSAPVPRPK